MLRADWGWSMAPVSQSEASIVMTDQSEASSDDEDAFWWRVNIGAICYWAAHWAAGRWLQSAAVLQTQTNVPCMCCMLHSCCSPHDDCGTLINTLSLMDTEHLSGDERAGCRIRVPQASRHRMTSAPAQMQWLDLKWRLQRGVWLMLLRHTFNWGGGRSLKRVSWSGGALAPVDFYLVWIFLEN